MKLQIGNVIKSHDFANNHECFMVGRVREIQDGMAVCDTISQTFAGESTPDFAAEFRTPLPGRFLMDDMYPNFKRIEVLS